MPFDINNNANDSTLTLTNEMGDFCQKIKGVFQLFEGRYSGISPIAQKQERLWLLPLESVQGWRLKSLFWLQNRVRSHDLTKLLEAVMTFTKLQSLDVSFMAEVLHRQAEV